MKPWVAVTTAWDFAFWSARFQTFSLCHVGISKSADRGLQSLHSRTGGRMKLRWRQRGWAGRNWRRCTLGLTRRLGSWCATWGLTWPNCWVARNPIFFGLNCFKISCDISFFLKKEKHFLSRLGGTSLGRFFLLFLSICFFRKNVLFFF